MNPLLEFKGFLTHSGQTYHADVDEVIEISVSAAEIMNRMKSVYKTIYPEIITSVGDTPGCVAAADWRGVDEVRAGNFREDLYFRLNVISIVAPPLRDRNDDVILLARHFVKKFSSEYGLPVSSHSAATRASVGANTIATPYRPGSGRPKPSRSVSLAKNSALAGSPVEPAWSSRLCPLGPRRCS